ncbi:MAG TPA: response regulator transcription factor [Chitinophagaceae bacterium]|jgi:DNA-binding response OmpR family regulator|nr:response regulator transcription factor [Chitinophagaceae bacterium]
MKSSIVEINSIDIKRKKILIIEDDEQIVELVDIHLKDNFCESIKAYSGEQGLHYAFTKKFDLIILDIMLPDMNGVEICRRLRSEKDTTPVMMLTARSEEIDKIIGLETGADDYLTKPFSIRELMARVKAVLRRTEINNNHQPNAVISRGALTIDPVKRKVMLQEKKIDLTPKEFDLLYLFMTNPGRSYSREALLNAVWGYEFNGYEHTVNSHINRLRAKIEEDLSHPKFILTSWGVGYRFTDEI